MSEAVESCATLALLPRPKLRVDTFVVSALPGDLAEAAYDAPAPRSVEAGSILWEAEAGGVRAPPGSSCAIEVCR